MKVVAISGSPRVKSFTHQMLEAFLKGLGVEAVIFKPHQMRISHCIGCWDCWLKNRGVCSIKDDMQKILPELDGADLLIWAFPLYVDGIPSHVKKVIDRLLPQSKGEMFVDQAGRTRHPRRHPKAQKVILISSCGFPEVENFEPLKVHFKAICQNAKWTLAGEILLPGAGAADSPMGKKKLELIEQAGRAFAEQGKIPADLEYEIAKQSINPDLYRAFATAQFEGKPLEIVKGLFAALISKFRN